MTGYLKTGPATGSVTLDDGTVYDVTSEFIVAPVAHHSAICFHIAKQHERTGKLTELVHGTGVSGCPIDAQGCNGRTVVVIGDESGHTLGHAGD